MDTPSIKMKQPILIAIAGAAGAGKSTLVRTVAALLDNATTVFFDDYAASSTYPSDFRAWVDSGAHPEGWQTPGFATALTNLRTGRPVIHPDGVTSLTPTPFIVVEEPFGRERQEVAAFFDMVILVDLPLEIALARKLLQYITWNAERKPAEIVIAGCCEFLGSYLMVGRDVNAVVSKRARASSDLQVNGTLATDILASTIAESIRIRYA
jgi:uridine kinase